jgi:hypothetical protein
LFLKAKIQKKKIDMNKYISVFVFFISSFGYAFGQNTEGKTNDNGRISLSVVVPNQPEEIPAELMPVLADKIQSIVTQNGMGGEEGASRFMVFPSVVVTSKNITSSAPIQTMLNLSLTLYVADYIDKKTFSTTTVTLKGVGASESKAYHNAFKSLKNSDKMEKFLATGKKAIISYYNDHCDFIEQQIKSKAAQGDYSGAIILATQVPETSKDCYSKLQGLIPELYKTYINNVCAERLTKARAAWAKKDVDSALNQLSVILPNTSCFEDADSLINEIKLSVDEDKKRIIEEQQKQYQDNVELQKLIITKATEVGVEEAKAKAEYWKSEQRAAANTILNIK